MLARCSYDLILTDVQMPEMDGIEMTQIVRSRNVLSESRRTIPIIVLTGSVALRDRERCIDAGMDDYLTEAYRDGRSSNDFDDKQMANRALAC